MSVAARLSLAVAAMVTLATLGACGPEQPPPATAGTAAPTANRTSTPATAAAPTAVTPERLCATVSIADVARISGFHIVSTKTDMSGDVSVCTFVRDDNGFTSGALIIQYQPKGRSTVELLKSKGESVSGFGQTAVWYNTAGQLSVELDGDAVFHAYVLDVRFHGNDPKAGATQVAQIAVPALLRH
jgi:hypothetical protein